MPVGERLVSKSGRRPHPLGYGSDAPGKVPQPAVGFGEARRRKSVPGVVEVVTPLRPLEHRVDHSIVDMILEQSIRVPPLGDYDQLGVIFQVGRLLCFEVAHPERRQPSTQSVRRDRGSPHP